MSNKIDFEKDILNPAKSTLEGLKLGSTHIQFYYERFVGVMESELSNTVAKIDFHLKMLHKFSISPEQKILASRVQVLLGRYKQSCRHTQEIINHFGHEVDILRRKDNLRYMLRFDSPRDEET